MFFVALATNDNTIAVHGIVAEETFKALTALKRSGRRAILVTGRELPDMLNVFPQIDLFDLVVAVKSRPSSPDRRMRSGRHHAADYFFSSPFSSASWKRSGAWICGEWPRSSKVTSVALGMRAAASLPSLA
jgi:hypothetical protein